MPDLLALRERRFYRDRALQTRGTVVSIKPNVPGADKRFVWSDYASYVLYTELLRSYTPLHKIAEHDREGLVFTLVFQEDPDVLKKACTELEQTHPLGRIMDLDVYGRNAVLSRADLGLPLRTCYVCEQPAVVCSRSQAHPQEQLRDCIREAVLDYLQARDDNGHLNATRCAEMSLLSELCREYGFGCVTVNHTGAHKDMDFFTFLQSLRMVARGISALPENAHTDFHTLRAYGRVVEKEMFQATHGVNTHKGAIFLYLLIAAAFRHNPDPSQISNEVQILAEPVGADFAGPANSHGLRLFAHHGVTGIRGEALRGFPSLFLADTLPETPEDFLPLTLQLMQRVEDTNVIHRGGLSLWQELKEKAARVENGDESVAALDRWCLMQRISTGGTADLIGATVFLHLMGECERKWKEDHEHNETGDLRFPAVK